jgi:hypothetical protein
VRDEEGFFEVAALVALCGTSRLSLPGPVPSGPLSLKGAMAPTNKDAFVAWSTGSRLDASYPKFNPFIYSLENDLPLLKLGFDDKWAPDQNYRAKDPVISYAILRWARVVLVLFGWFQATVLAAAVASRFKN